MNTSSVPVPVSGEFPHAQQWDHHDSSSALAAVMTLEPSISVDRPVPGTTTREGLAETPFVRLADSPLSSVSMP